MSFTIYNEKIHTGIHKDAPPVIAKINFPVLMTQKTHTMFGTMIEGNEIDRIECTKPIVSEIRYQSHCGDWSQCNIS